MFCFLGLPQIVGPSENALSRLRELWRLALRVRQVVPEGTLGQESHQNQRLTASESVTLYGPESLDDATILALLLSPESPDPATLLAQTSLNRLIGMGPVELLALGIQPSDCARVLCLYEVARRSTRRANAHILNPRMAAAYVLPKATGLGVERVGLVCLDSKGRVIADLVLSQGTATGSQVSPREVFKEALRVGATSILIWHNHPSNDCSPSREDNLLTRRLVSCGQELGIPVADHLIVGSCGEQWHSYRVSEGWDSSLGSGTVFPHQKEEE
jgi:DNA repair protein RadC